MYFSLKHHQKSQVQVYDYISLTQFRSIPSDTLWKFLCLMNLASHISSIPPNMAHSGLLPVCCLPREVRTLNCSPENQHLLAINTAFNTHASVEVTA